MSSFHEVKLVAYNISHLNKKEQLIHTKSKCEVIIPVESFILFNCHLVHSGAKSFVYSNGDYSSNTCTNFDLKIG